MLVARREPRNPEGWLLLGVAVAGAGTGPRIGVDQPTQLTTAAAGSVGLARPEAGSQARTGYTGQRNREMARQTSIVASAIIPASPERVWEIACDTSRYPEWVENTLRMIRPDGPTRADTTYEELSRIAGPWKSVTPVARHRVRPSPPAGTTGGGRQHREGHGGDHRAFARRPGHQFHPHRPLQAAVRAGRRAHRPRRPRFHYSFSGAIGASIRRARSPRELKFLNPRWRPADAPTPAATASPKVCYLPTRRPDTPATRTTTPNRAGTSVPLRRTEPASSTLASSRRSGAGAGHLLGNAPWLAPVVTSRSVSRLDMRGHLFGASSRLT